MEFLVAKIRGRTPANRIWALAVIKAGETAGRLGTSSASFMCASPQRSHG